MRADLFYWDGLSFKSWWRKGNILPNFYPVVWFNVIPGVWQGFHPSNDPFWLAQYKNFFVFPKQIYRLLVRSSNLELLTWLLIHFWCNKSWLWFRFNTCHVAFGFLIFYYTINLSPWTLFQHSLETISILTSWCPCPCKKFRNSYWIPTECSLEVTLMLVTTL